MATYDHDYLERLLAAIDAFEEAFEQWMTTQVELDHVFGRGMLPNVEPREDADARELQRLELAVAEAAGLAARAATITGAKFNVQGLGLVDPIANWAMMSSPKPVIAPRDVRTTVAAIRGRLKAMLLEPHESLPAGFRPSRPRSCTS